MMRTAAIQSAIRSVLLQQGPCLLGTLLARLPQFTWNEIFTVVDQLSREGQLVLRHPARFDYEVSIGPTQPVPEQVHAGRHAEGDTLSGYADPDPQVYEELTPA